MLNLDMRAPADGVPPEDLYRAALECAETLDEGPATLIMFGEHHGADDGYLPAPFVLAAAVAARTRRTRLTVPTLPSVHSAPALAEQAAVLDLISGGRLDLLVMLGYLPWEFDLHGRSFHERGRRTDEGLRVLRAAFAGEPLPGRSEPLYVTPRPLQRPGPPLYVGGSVAASACRAAALGDGFWPTTPDPELLERYRQECRARGAEPGPILASHGVPFAVFVTEDVEATWEAVGPHARHAVNTYARWTHELTDNGGPFTETFADTASLRAAGVVEVVTPEGALELAQRLEAAGEMIILHPLLGGTHPDVGRRSVELFVERVLPHLDVTPDLRAHGDALEARWRVAEAEHGVPAAGTTS